MTSAEVRLLRFLQAAGAHQRWVPYTTIRNTEDLLPGDEKALQSLLGRELILRHIGDQAYRISDKGIKALGQRSSQL